MESYYNFNREREAVYGIYVKGQPYGWPMAVEVLAIGAGAKATAEPARREAIVSFIMLEILRCDGFEEELNL